MLISIIIPCHNSSATIYRAVDSVFSQTYTDWELIMVNNNSTDDTWVKLINIKKNNPDKAITVLDEKKKGAPAARNKGLYEAKGEWIQFLDADDELLPNKLEKQIKVITKEIDVIYSPYFDIYNEQKISQSIIIGDLWEALIKGRIGITSVNLFRKNKLLEINGWNENLTSSQDTRLIFDLMKKEAHFFSLDIPLVYKHSSEDTITGTKDKNKIKRLIFNFIELRKDILAFLKDKPYDYKKYEVMYEYMYADIFLRFSKTLPYYTFSEYNKRTKHGLLYRIKTNYSFFMRLIK